LHLRRKKQRELLQKKHLPLLLRPEKRNQESPNSKLNSIERLQKPRKLDSLMRKKSKNALKLKLKERD